MNPRQALGLGKRIVGGEFQFEIQRTAFERNKVVHAEIQTRLKRLVDLYPDNATTETQPRSSLALPFARAVMHGDSEETRIFVVAEADSEPPLTCFQLSYFVVVTEEMSRTNLTHPLRCVDGQQLRGRQSGSESLPPFNATAELTLIAPDYLKPMVDALDHIEAQLGLAPLEPT